MVSDGLSFHHDRRSSLPRRRPGDLDDDHDDAHYNSWQTWQAAHCPAQFCSFSRAFGRRKYTIPLFGSSAPTETEEDFHFTFSFVSFFIRGKNPLCR